MGDYPWFPMFVDLSERRALIVGGGRVAARRAAALCREMGIPVNVCSDPSLCDFYFPGVAVRAGAVVGVTASGRDHRRAAALTRRARAMLAEEGGGADEFQP